MVRFFRGPAVRVVKASRFPAAAPEWNPFPDAVRILGKDTVAWWRRTTRARGPVHALRVIWHTALDSLFDFRHGTDTVRRIQSEHIATDSPHRAHSSAYGATRALPFFGLLRRLELPKDVGFVDLGSGKGRILLLAADWGFKRVTGVEFSSALCDISRRNLAAYFRRRRPPGEVEIIESDVAAYTFRPDDGILFLFDPFDGVVMARVLGNLRESLRLHPRPVWLLYNTPVEHALIDQSALFLESHRHWVGGTEFLVFHHPATSPV